VNTQSKTRIGIIGLGKVAEQIHLPACASLPAVELVGACDTDPQRRKCAAEKFSVRAVFEDAATLLEKAQPNIVIIGTPPATHRALCLLALEHGAHVLCEKPFVASVAEADEVIAAADACSLHVWVNNQYRYMDTYRVPRERIARGDFGQLYFLQCWQQMYHPPTMESNWRATLKQSVLYEFGTHALDLICYFFDALPLSVNAHTPRVGAHSDVDVLTQLTLRFPDERLATIAFNRVSRAPERYLEMRLDCEQASLRLSLGGVARAALDWSRALGRPIARVSFVRGGEARVESGGRSKVIAQEQRPAFASATATHLRECIAALQRGERANHSARHARELLRIVFSAYESARSGETVWLNKLPV
jgi:predicted dehydrogenase